MRNIGRKTWTGATLAFALFVQPIIAFAGTVGTDGIGFVPVSEPETLALVAIGAVAVIISRWKKRK
ncbi:MAG: PEP-CTERM sorting domain-containing protein [Burkholderiales bacterium]